MASQRPGFARTNTESHHDLAKETEKESGKPEVFAGDVKEAESHEAHLPRYDGEEVPDVAHGAVVTTARDLVTTVLRVEDDPSLNPWTFRMFFLGMPSNTVDI